MRERGRERGTERDRYMYTSACIPCRLSFHTGSRMKISFGGGGGCIGALFSL